MGNIILFALLGAVFYYIFKSYARYEQFSKEAFKDFSLSYDALKNSELGLFVALSAKVAKADGKVDTLEAELISNLFDDICAVFPQPEQTRTLFKQIFDEEKNITHNTQQLAQQLAHATRNNKAMQHNFMGFLIQLAFADGHVSKSEEDILAQIAEAMAFDPKVYHTIFDQFEQMHQNTQTQQHNSLQEAYTLLGVSENDDMQTIKKAYRKLVRQYHPDIIKSQNKDEHYMKEATQKTQQINAAYEMIKKARE